MNAHIGLALLIVRGVDGALELVKSWDVSVRFASTRSPPRAMFSHACARLAGLSVGGGAWRFSALVSASDRRFRRPSSGSNPCEHGGQCVNTEGSFTCNCVRGYAGPRCEQDLNECASNPCRNDATCLDQIGDYTCICMPGRPCSALSNPSPGTHLFVHHLQVEFSFPLLCAYLCCV